MFRCRVNFYSSCPLPISWWILIGQSLYFISLSMFKCQIQNLALNKHSLIFNGKDIRYTPLSFPSFLLFLFSFSNQFESQIRATDTILPAVTSLGDWLCIANQVSSLGLPRITDLRCHSVSQSPLPIRALVKPVRKEAAGPLGF